MSGLMGGMNPLLLQNLSSILGQSNFPLNQLSNLVNMNNFGVGNMQSPWMPSVPGKMVSHMWNEGTKVNQNSYFYLIFFKHVVV